MGVLRDGPWLNNPILLDDQSLHLANGFRVDDIQFIRFPLEHGAFDVESRNPSVLDPEDFLLW